MNEVQQRIGDLQEKGWTLAALAHELGLTVNAVEKWKAGQRYPANAKPVLVMLGQLANRRRIPKRRRYVKGSRQRAGGGQRPLVVGCISLDTSRPPTLEKAPRGQALRAARGFQVPTSRDWRESGGVPQSLNLTRGRDKVHIAILPTNY